MEYKKSYLFGDFSMFRAILSVTPWFVITKYAAKYLDIYVVVAYVLLMND